jgi:Flp pilus assembly CpaF family ATPase
MIAEAVNVIVYMEKAGAKRVVKDVVQVRGTKKEQYDLASLVAEH